MVKWKKEIRMALMLCFLASALMIITSTASEDHFSRSRCYAELTSDIIGHSQEKAKSLSDCADIIRRKVDSRHPKKAVKYYPTGLIVTASELAENRNKIREANLLMRASGINISYPVSWD